MRTLCELLSKRALQHGKIPFMDLALSEWSGMEWSESFHMMLVLCAAKHIWSKTASEVAMFQLRSLITTMNMIFSLANFDCFAPN
jgi:hypothetical protein